ncbi:hypothetical protein BN1708_016869, partial [Verticillium longisporum]
MAPKEAFWDGHLLDSETYVGGHVESIEAGVFRADIPVNFAVDPTAVDELLHDLDSALRFTIEVEEKKSMADVENYEEVKAQVAARLQALKETPNRMERPLIYHLDYDRNTIEERLIAQVEGFAVEWASQDVQCEKCRALRLNEFMEHCVCSGAWVESLELKAEKDNAEVRVEQVSEYQAIVDAEWQIIYKKLEAIHATGAKVVLSKLPIGDLATQYFADRDIFCAGRVAAEDMERVVQATGAVTQSTCSDILHEHLGTCGSFDERQIGGERFNFFEDCPEAKTCTLVLRGGAEQFIAEVERSLHDAIMIVKRAIKNHTIVGGGGATEMEVSAYLHRFADRDVSHKQQAIIKSFAKALEVIPRQLCENAGFDATDILNKLRVEHRKGKTWAGVDFNNEGVADMMERF